MKPKKTLLVLVDADMFAYRAANSAEQEICWNERTGLWTLHSYLPDAMANFYRICTYAEERIKDKLKEQGISYTLPHYTVWTYVFSCRQGKNFRRHILSTYKANRAGKRKPLAYHRLVQEIESRFKTQSIYALEADDVIGLLAYKAKKQVLIISGDKDLRQIPAVFRYDFLKEELSRTPPAAAEYYHLKQTLIGDRTDGYEGCPGFGEKTADKLFAEHGVSWQTVVDAYESKGLTEADALRQARVAYILHKKGDYNASRTHGKEVKLWTPPTTAKPPTSAKTS